MSTSKLNPSVINFVTVIVRAYGDEPVVFRAIGVGKNSVIIAGDDESRGMGYPAGFVYVYDACLFDKLESAFNLGDSLRLSNLWSEADHYDGNWDE